MSSDLEMSNGRVWKTVWLVLFLVFLIFSLTLGNLEPAMNSWGMFTPCECPNSSSYACWFLNENNNNDNKNANFSFAQTIFLKHK